MAAFKRSFPFRLNSAEINMVALPPIGVFRLLSWNPGTGEQPRLRFVGMTDRNFSGTLKSHFPLTNYGVTHFTVEETATVKDAFDLTCREFHAEHPDLNHEHPESPIGTSYPCPDGECSESARR